MFHDDDKPRDFKYGKDEVKLIGEAGTAAALVPAFRSS
jgi:hypothetical protein